jgi:hypothetical protein
VPEKSKTWIGFASQKMALGSTWEAAQRDGEAAELLFRARASQRREVRSARCAGHARLDWPAVLKGKRRIAPSASAHHARDRRYISTQLRQMSQLIAATPSRSAVDAQAACVDAPVSSRAAEDFCGVLATLGDFIHGDHHHPWTLPMNGAHNHNAAR